MQALHCRRVRADLPAFVDGALPPARAAAAGRHIECCQACRLEVVELRALQEQLRSLPPLPGAEQARERVFARFRQSVAQAPKVSSPVAYLRELLLRPPMAYTMAATAALVVALIVPAEPGGLTVFPDHTELAVLSQRHDLHVAQVSDATPTAPGISGALNAPLPEGEIR